jgi:hypothetical protein
MQKSHNPLVPGSTPGNPDRVIEVVIVVAKTLVVANERERADVPRNSRLFISITAFFIQNSIS